MGSSNFLTPNYSARTKFTDVAGYIFGLFLLSLPILPFPALRFYFAIATAIFYLVILTILASLDFAEVVKRWVEGVKSHQLFGKLAIKFE